MEKDRGFRVIAVIALVLAVVGLAVGFAAFSATFTIEEETVTVNPSQNLLQDNMKYVTNSAAVSGVTGGITAENANAGAATNDKWSGITATFTDKGSVTFTATVENASNYVAYLSSIKSEDSTNNPNTSEGKITCVAGENTDATLVAAACEGIEVDVTIADATNHLSGKITSKAAANATVTEASQAVSAAATNGTNTVTVVVSYAGEATLPDGTFTVYIPTIAFDYSTSEVFKAA